MSKFKSLKVVDNFYQNNLFFPMPTVAITTLCDDGSTTIGSYSLVFPYYIAGKDYYAMILEARNSSNTAQNILKTGKCALNFVKDDRKYFKELVRLGFSGQDACRKDEGLQSRTNQGRSRGRKTAHRQRRISSHRMYLGRHFGRRLQVQRTYRQTRRRRATV